VVDVSKRTVPMARVGKQLNQILKDFDHLTQAKTNKGIRAAIIQTWGKIIISTPVDEGRARGNWFIDTQVTDKTGRKSKMKAGSYVAKNTPVKILGTKLFMFNNLPYIQKLEFGGYGNENTEKTNSAGFSKLAPKGMVRINLLKWGSTLKKIFKTL